MGERQAIITVNNKFRTTSKILLFWCNYIFLILAISRVPYDIGNDNIAFLIKNLGTFACSVTITGIIIHYFSEHIYKAIIILVLLILLLLII